jgi:hypothetical protein
MFDRLRALIRRRRHRPTYFQQKIADRTGEATIDILERHLAMARCTPFSIDTVERIDYARVLAANPMPLVDAINRVAASGWNPDHLTGLVEILHGDQSKA